MAAVLFFGRISQLQAEGPSAPTDSTAFREVMEANFPELRAPGIKMAVNRVVVTRCVPIEPGDEIAFMSPMSGG